MKRQTPIAVTLSAEQVSMLLQVCEHGCALNPVDADFIAGQLREAVAEFSRKHEVK